MPTQQEFIDDVQTVINHVPGLTITRGYEKGSTDPATTKPDRHSMPGQAFDLQLDKDDPETYQKVVKFFSLRGYSPNLESPDSPHAGPGNQRTILHVQITPAGVPYTGPAAHRQNASREPAPTPSGRPLPHFHAWDAAGEASPSPPPHPPVDKGFPLLSAATRKAMREDWYEHPQLDVSAMQARWRQRHPHWVSGSIDVAFRDVENDPHLRFLRKAGGPARAAAGDVGLLATLRQVPGAALESVAPRPEVRERHLKMLGPSTREAVEAAEAEAPAARAGSPEETAAKEAYLAKAAVARGGQAPHVPTEPELAAAGERARQREHAAGLETIQRERRLQEEEMRTEGGPLVSGVVRGINLAMMTALPWESAAAAAQAAGLGRAGEVLLKEITGGMWGASDTLVAGGSLDQARTAFLQGFGMVAIPEAGAAMLRGAHLAPAPEAGAEGAAPPASFTDLLHPHRRAEIAKQIWRDFILNQQATQEARALDRTAQPQEVAAANLRAFQLKAQALAPEVRGVGEEGQRRMIAREQEAQRLTRIQVAGEEGTRALRERRQAAQAEPSLTDQQQAEANRQAYFEGERRVQAGRPEGTPAQQPSPLNPVSVDRVEGGGYVGRWVDQRGREHRTISFRDEHDAREAILQRRDSLTVQAVKEAPAAEVPGAEVEAEVPTQPEAPQGPVPTPTTVPESPSDIALARTFLDAGGLENISALQQQFQWPSSRAKAALEAIRSERVTKLQEAPHAVVPPPTEVQPVVAAERPAQAATGAEIAQPKPTSAGGVGEPGAERPAEATPPAETGPNTVPAVEPAKSATTLFTEEKAQAAAEYFKAKRGQKGAVGFGPRTRLSQAESGMIEDLRHAVNLGGYHFERGARTFAAWSAKMAAEAGEWVRPYLNQIWDRVTGRSIADKYAGSINLERLNTADEVKAAYEDALNRMEAEVAAVRRGVVSHAKTQAQADALELSDRDLTSLAKTFGQETARRKALRDLTQGRAEAVAEAMGRYEKSGDLNDLLDVMQRYAEFEMPFLVAEKGAAEAGRTLESYKMLAQARRADRSAKERAIEAAQKMLAGRSLTPEQLAALAKIPEGDVQGMYNFLRQLSRVNPEDKALYVFTSSILSGTGTHLRNMLWNVNRLLTETLVRPVRGLVDIPVARLQRRPRAFYPEETAAIVAEVAAIPRGARKALEAFKAGITPEEAAKFEAVRWEPRGGTKNPLTWPLRALSAEDAGQKVMMSEGSLLEQGIRQARQEGLRGKSAMTRAAELVRTPTIDMVREAQAHADRLAMTGETASTLRFLLKARESLPRPLRFLAKVVQPFTNVPWKLTGQVLEHSPMALVRLASKEIRGSPEASDVIARAALGSAVIAAVATADSLGWIEVTGAVPRGSTARDEFYRTKKVAYSLRIGGHRVSYRNFGPFSLAFAAVAAAKDVTIRDPQADFGDRAIIGALAVGSYISDASFVSGLTSLSDMLRPDATAEEFKRWIVRVGKGFAWPSGAERVVSRIIDPYIRDPQTLYERLIADMPFLSRTVPAKLDVLGRQVKREGGSGLMALLPEQAPSAEIDPIDAELARLDITIGPASKSLTIGDKKRVLSRNEWRKYQEAIGRAMYEDVGRAMKMDAYKTLSDEWKQIVLNDFKDTARRAATDRFKESYEAEVAPGVETLPTEPVETETLEPQPLEQVAP